MMTRLAAGVLMVVGFVGCAHMATAATVEVVESVPLETTLAVPGVRDTQTVWLELVNSAKTSIDLEQFYINEVAGESLTPVIQAIQARAAAGVHVRFLLDANMYKSTYSAVPNSLAQIPGIEVRTIDFSSRGGIMHAKYIIADGSRAYVGSANFDWLALSHIHEVGLNVTDATTGSALESIFSTDWTVGTPVSGSKSASLVASASLSVDFSSVGSPAGLSVLASPPDVNPAGVGSTLDRLKEILGNAVKTVHIQVYEYNTLGEKFARPSWKDLDTAIRGAAKRGVQVEVLTDAVALKQGKADLEALAKVPNVQVKVVTIPQWSGGHLDYARLIHSKYLIADGTVAWVGSENWNEGYFTNTRNVGLTLSDTSIASTLEAVYAQVWTSAYTSAP